MMTVHAGHMTDPTPFTPQRADPAVDEERRHDDGETDEATPSASIAAEEETEPRAGGDIDAAEPHADGGVAALKETVERVLGTKNQARWAVLMFDEEKGAIPMLLAYIEEKKRTVEGFKVDDVFGKEDLDVNYTRSTFDKDARIFKLRHRHRRTFRKVLEGKMKNTEARAKFAKLLSKDFEKIKEEVSKYLKEQGDIKTTCPVRRGELLARVSEAVGSELLDKEKEQVGAWLRAGKISGRAGKGNKRRSAGEVDYNDPKRCRKTLKMVLEAVQEITGISLTVNKCIADEGRSFREQLVEWHSEGSRDDEAEEGEEGIDDSSEEDDE
jgi:hypothetical protein